MQPSIPSMRMKKVHDSVIPHGHTWDCRDVLGSTVTPIVWRSGCMSRCFVWGRLCRLAQRLMSLVYQAFQGPIRRRASCNMGIRDDGSSSDRSMRRDPFSMLPFCDYHMGDYFNPHLQVRTHDSQSTTSSLWRSPEHWECENQSRM